MSLASKLFKALSNKKDTVEVVAIPSDDLELIAAITAAIAATLNVTSDKFVVRSIKPMNHWNDAAKRDVYFGGDI